MILVEEDWHYAAAFDDKIICCENMRVKVLFVKNHLIYSRPLLGFKIRSHK